MSASSRGSARPVVTPFCTNGAAAGPLSQPPTSNTFGGLVSTRHEYEHLFSIYVPIAIGVFAVIVLAIAFCVLRYRRRPPERAARWHENNPLEGGYALILAGTVAFLLYLTFTAEHRVDTVSARETPSVTIDVIGAKWEWTFRYSASGITQRSGTVGRQPLVVPTGEPVRFNLTSTDVIHGFWIPGMLFMKNAVPGHTNVISVTPNRTGTYRGQCTQFCGLWHAKMTLVLKVLSPAKFSAWIHAQQQAQAKGGSCAPTGSSITLTAQHITWDKTCIAAVHGGVSI